MKSIDRVTLSRHVRKQASQLVLLTSLLFVCAGSLWSHFALGGMILAIPFALSWLMIHGFAFVAVKMERVRLPIMVAQVMALQLYFHNIINIAKVPYIPLAPVFFTISALTLTAYARHSLPLMILNWSIAWTSAGLWIHQAPNFSEGPKTALFFALGVNFVFVAGFYFLSRFLSYRLSNTLDQMGHAKAYDDRRIQSSKLQSLGELTASLIHEINNPLSAIGGYSHQIREEIKEEPFSEASLELVKNANDRIKFNIDRIQEIIRIVRNFSRDETRESFVPTSLKAVVNDSVFLLKHIFKSSHVDLRLDLPERDIEVNGSFVQLSQVLVNLLSNARDAVAEVDRKSVVVGFHLSGEFAELWVEDSGPGIEDDISEEIFRPFFTTKAVGKGTGLGLAICKTIMERHSGDIRYILVQDRSGRITGTRFILKFPALSQSIDRSAA